MNIELETLEVKIYANLRQFLPFFQQNFKLNNFSLRGQLLRPPYLVPTMCGGLHAKFQDSRVYNKKGTPPFHCLGQIMEYNLVCTVQSKHLPLETLVEYSIAQHWGSGTSSEVDKQHYQTLIDCIDQPYKQ